MMREKTVEPDENRELEKFRERLINENEALNKLLRNLQNPAYRTKESEASIRIMANENKRKSK